MGTYKYIRWFSEVNRNDIPLVGGKGANLGELTQNGVAVPPGFCVIAGAYRDFIRISGLNASIENIIRNIDFENTDDLSEKCGEIRKLIMEAPFPKEIEKEVKKAYAQLAQKTGLENVQVAVRSSATAEDLPDASFAGQQDTYLHIRGAEEVLKHVQKCWASLWTARATYYREKQDFNHFEVALSAVVQKMVRSEKSGVLFTANPVSNDLNQIMINASWGLGEAVVSGVVTPDEFILEKDHLDVVEKTISEKNTMIVEKDGDIGTAKVAVKDFLGPDKVKMQCLTDMEIITLGKAGKTIESLYNAPQDIEWALDQDTKELYILQARPITTLAKGESSVDQNTTPKETKLNVLARGLAASPGTAVGKVIVIEDINEIARVKDGDILVTGMTNPDMVPAMRKAAAVVTDEGGRTCHAAIVSRELGIPCIVGSKNGTAVLAEGVLVTVDATRGVVFEGNVVPEKKEAEKATLVSPGAQALPIEELVHQLAPITGTKIYMNLGEPSIIDRYKNLPFDGIGLMRTEFIFTNMVGIHPMYLVKTGQGKLLVDKMSEGITTVAQAIYPRPVVVRMSDFRTNEFRGLKGGEEVEPVENNPMIGWRGVSRYISSEYEAGFRLECQAMRKVREEYGLINVWMMLPFVRTTWELESVMNILCSEGLERSSSFKIWIMAEVPSVVFAAEEFAQMVDGFSIGSNDLTQLVMGVDRDSGILNNMGYFDERNIAVQRAIRTLIQAAHKHGKTCSICGQGPSLYPDFAEFLVREGIDSMSVNPDTVAYTRKLVAGVEQRIILNSIRNR
ncbi:MAG: phosphoenolpyruvate synthase [Aminobacterium colombiense]|jgi:pyruvate,water dikinase|uniref:Phosphoenolpyruvate synthase n=1 Tax=Aminobacterium colombiense (strain DSM 12261 / ALA-1) TaxID=572547 RepID=D5EEB5_AMICL|nr:MULTISPECIES: phosphoenolpyruvate synthase [Aminobacterium]MDD2379303.1 phosphoenolpyruvate synthase [Aminobacterium colombiense]ADE56897.1 phosphoenolpyruvate synthase [Aminobacterium colombiense DSM 12261]MDD3767764.1 phosphoenolpyruvate synthase [Aminobacterium colombiense]MDD4265638.1 phosphoenolpyruvate synthase [Aminobacterium colombiense]MDD4586221.1 phosphoenolpyruvate synthase [Aminobacterium colombiense]